MSADQGVDADAVEFLAASRHALESDPGDAALNTLGWWDLLDHLDDPPLRLAVFSLFRAHGATLSDSSALSGLAAEPYRVLTGHASGTLLAALPRRTRRGTAYVVVGNPAGRDLLIDRAGAARLVGGTAGGRHGWWAARPVEWSGGLTRRRGARNPARHPTRGGWGRAACIGRRWRW